MSIGEPEMPDLQKPKIELISKPEDFDEFSITEDWSQLGGNTGHYSISSRHFIDQNYPVGDLQDPFEKEKIKAQIEKRLAHEDFRDDYLNYTSMRDNAYPQQGRTGFCGPAAFMYALLIDRPDLYKQYIVDLWDFGEAKLGKLQIKASKGVKRPTDLTIDWNGQTLMPAIDWMTMASLSDSSNLIFSSAKASDMQIGDITGPGTMDHWFEGVGSERVYVDISPFPGSSKFIPGTITVADVIKFNQYIEQGHHAVLLIGSALLAPEGREPFFTKFKNHWIVAIEPFYIEGTTQLVHEETPLDTMISVKIFTWGGVVIQEFTLKKLLKYWYGGMIYERIS